MNCNLTQLIWGVFVFSIVMYIVFWMQNSYWLLLLLIFASSNCDDKSKNENEIE